jgi:hypothetical protein
MANLITYDRIMTKLLSLNKNETSVIIHGNNTAIATNKLIDTTVNFRHADTLIMKNMIVKNVYNSSWSYVSVNPASDTELTLAADIFTETPAAYIIYSYNDFTIAEIEQFITDAQAYIATRLKKLYADITAITDAAGLDLLKKIIADKTICDIGKSLYLNFPEMTTNINSLYCENVEMMLEKILSGDIILQQVADDDNVGGYTEATDGGRIFKTTSDNQDEADYWGNNLNNNLNN